MSGKIFFAGILLAATVSACKKGPLVPGQPSDTNTDSTQEVDSTLT